MGNISICEQFVSFETAKMLKEVGFEEKVNSCFMYDKYADKDEYEFEGGYAIVRKALPDNYNCYEKSISRPTQAIAARWLREVHRIVVDATFIPPSTYGDAWRYFIGEMDDMVWNGDYVPSDEFYETYEKALEAGLQEALRFIFKNKEDEKDNVQLIVVR